MSITEIYTDAENKTSNSSEDPGQATPVGGAVKRIFDITFSLFALAGSIAIFLVVAVIIRIASPGQVFFRHERVGFDGRTFPCLKFRTMHLNSDVLLNQHLAQEPEARAEFERDRKLKNDPRIIPVVGHVLRKTSLDELPQLWNVLRGEMSIVGPRPVTEEEIGYYGNALPCYNAVRPGITGLWQVSGRNALTFSERVKIDKSYVLAWSFRSDLKIILRTGKVVMSGKGAY